jgi:RNA polymerase sigma factor for flagellar operon FliA
MSASPVRASCAPERSPESTRRPRQPRERTEARSATAMEAALLAEFAPVVRQIAGGFQRRLPRNVLRDDLIAAGMSGLWDAIRKHGAERAGNFDWYVRVRVRGAILDELRAQDWLPRRARAAAAAAARTSDGAAPSAPVVLRFDEVSETEQARCLVASDGSSSDRHLEERLVRETLAKAVELLPERERHIVSLHYFKGVKFKELGRMLGVSEPRISQLHSRAMGRLRVLLAEAA